MAKLSRVRVTKPFTLLKGETGKLVQFEQGAVMSMGENGVTTVHYKGEMHNIPHDTKLRYFDYITENKDGHE